MRCKVAFTDPELVELAFLVGFINMLNLFNNGLGVRYNGEYALLDGLLSLTEPQPAGHGATEQAAGRRVRQVDDRRDRDKAAIGAQFAALNDGDPDGFAVTPGWRDERCAPAPIDLTEWPPERQAASDSTGPVVTIRAASRP